MTLGEAVRPGTPLRAGGADAPMSYGLLLVCGLCYFAQTFLAWGWPALEGYPAIERWIDPHFLLHDFYTNTQAGYGVNSWQGAVFGTIQQWTGVHYALQLAVLAALRCLTWPFILYSFLKALLRDGFAARVGVVLGTFACFNLPKTLAWPWLWGDTSAAMLAVYLMTCAWTLMLLRRPALGFVLLAFAMLFQPLVGVHSMIFVLLIYLFDYDRDEKLAVFRQPWTIAAAALFGATFLAQWFALTPPAAQRLPVSDYVRILVWERHPTDFLPSKFGIRSLVSAALGTLAVLLMLLRDYRALSRRALIFATLGAYALICLFGGIFVEWIPVRFVIDLIPYRTANIGGPVMLAIIAIFAARMMRERRWTALAIIAAAFLATGPVGYRLHLPMESGDALLLIGAIAGRFGRLPTDATVEPVARDYRWGWMPVIALLLAISADRFVLRHDAMILPTLANQHPLYRWAQSETDPDARFLMDQFSADYPYISAIFPQEMRLVGRRAVVASRDFPFRESAIRPWYTTWDVALNHGANDFINTATADRLAAICRTLRYDYVVRAKPLPAGTLPEVKRFAPVHGAGEVYVYKGCGSKP